MTGAFGVVFVLALAASMAAAAGAPGTDSVGVTVELFVIRHYHALQASLALQVVAVVFLCLFTGGLAGYLKRADEAIGDSWAPGFTVGAAGLAVLLAASAAAQGAYQEMSHSGAVPEQVQELFRVSNDLAAVAGLFLAVLLATLGTSGILNGTVPVPLAWFGLLDGLVGLVGAGGIGTTRNALGTLEFVALVLFLVWSLGLSIWLLAVPDPAGAGSGGAGPGGPHSGAAGPVVAPEG